MERDLAGIRLTISDYHRLAALCRDDPKFPSTYAAWHCLLDDGMRQLLSEGQSIEPVALDVEAFARWCERVALHPGLDALRAYLIISRRTTHGAQDDAPASGAAPRGKGGPRDPKKAARRTTRSGSASPDA